MERSLTLDDEDRTAFKDALDKFVRTYSFLSQIVSFGDSKLECDYVYCRALAARHDPVFALRADGVQRRVAELDDRCGAGVVGVGLVDPAGVHQPDPSRQLRGHVDDVFAGADELLGQQRTNSGGALDRPSTWFEGRCPLEMKRSLLLLFVGGALLFGGRVRQ